MALLCLVLFDAIVSASAIVTARSEAAQPSAPAPAQAEMEAYHVSFEIKNLNYYDLSEEICPEKDEDDAAADGQDGHSQEGIHGNNPLGDMDHALEHVFDHAEAIVEKSAAAVEKGSEATAAAVEKESSEALGKIQGPALLQIPACNHENHGETAIMNIKQCTTAMEIMRYAIMLTVRDVVNCALHQGHVAAITAAGPTPALIHPDHHALAPSPAQMVPLPRQGFLQGRDFVFAPAPAVPKPNLGIFVTFTPGTKLENGDTTVMVDVAFMDTPNNQMHDVLSMLPAMNHLINTGCLHKEMRDVLDAIFGFDILLGRLKANIQKIKQWPIDQCEIHIQQVVQNFTLEYTREQVPRAMYNECTNFFTKFSFSHDYVLDPMDAVRCRQATVKFTKKWEYGKNSEAKDFEDMCMYACEAKYGKDAPKCHIAAGDNMMKQHA